MASSIDPDVLATSLAKARAYYNDKQYPKATAVFKQITNSCACGVQVRATPCCCKSLVSAIANSAIEAELRKKCICSAKADVRCRNADHIDALDGLAAVYEAKRHMDTAIVIAEAMINLAPREPKGFLRLGRVLRLQRSYRHAFQTYQQGIELVGKKNPSHPLLSTLRQMKDKIRNPAVATDPLPLMPLELVAMIFKNLDFRSLCNCLRVSKSWKNLLTTKDKTIQSLWRIQHFTRCTKPVRPAQLQKYATYSGSHVTELVIQDCRQFGVDSNTFRWIALSCRSLAVLKLQATRELELLTVSNAIRLCAPQLTSLYLGFHAPFMLEFVHKAVAASAATLRELTLLNFPSRFAHRVAGAEVAAWPVLRRLRTLRLGGRPHKEKAVLNISSFMHTSPNVEEVWLEGVYVTFREEIEHPENPWPHLKRLFVGQEVGWQRIAHAPFPLPSDIEELHLMHCDHIFAFLSGPFFSHPDTYPSPQNLRKFTLRDRVPSGRTGADASTSSSWPGYLQRWVRPSLASGALRELGMMFPRPHPPWLRSASLRFLGVKGLSLEFGTDPMAVDAALADLLERFPGVEGLDVAREPVSDAALAAAVRRGVRTVYYRGGYHLRREVREWAREKYGASIIEGDYVTNLPMYLPDEQYKEFY